MVAETLLRVILQPGHGLGNHDVNAFDQGAVSCFGNEHEIVAAIADEVASSDPDVIETPPCGPDCVGRHKKKFDKRAGRLVPVSHLSFVIDWINDTAIRHSDGSAQHDYVLSLHMDAPDDDVPEPERFSGVSVYYSDEAPEQRRHEAEFVSSVVAAKLGIPNKGAHSDTESYRQYLGILRNTAPPALLIELGFVTNPDDVKAVRACGQEAVAAAIAKLRELR